MFLGFERGRSLRVINIGVCVTVYPSSLVSAKVPKPSSKERGRTERYYFVNQDGFAKLGTNFLKLFFNF